VSLMRTARNSSRRPTGTGGRRGFNLIEMLIALSITGTLLTATLVALDASFFAYQRTTEVASTHTIGRMAMHRILTLVRTGREFGPTPPDPFTTTVVSNEIQFRAPEPSNAVMRLIWIETADPGAGYPVGEALYIDPDIDDANDPIVLLEGVVAQTDAGGDPVPAFTLEFVKGRQLYRATIDLMIIPDDNMALELDGENLDTIRLVASAMPRSIAY